MKDAGEHPDEIRTNINVVDIDTKVEPICEKVELKHLSEVQESYLTEEWS